MEEWNQAINQLMKPKCQSVSWPIRSMEKMFAAKVLVEKMSMQRYFGWTYPGPILQTIGYLFQKA